MALRCYPGSPIGNLPAYDLQRGHSSFPISSSYAMSENIHAYYTIN